MSLHRSRRAVKCGSPKPRVKVWLEFGGRYGFGLGLSEILCAIERGGSIKQAATSLGKSYRYVWDRIKEAEKAIGARLVNTRVGGQGKHRSWLTETARKLTSDFLAVRTGTIAAMEAEFARRFR